MQTVSGETKCYRAVLMLTWGTRYPKLFSQEIHKYGTVGCWRRKYSANESDVLTNIIVISAGSGTAADYSTQINPKSVRSSSSSSSSSTGRQTMLTENYGNYYSPFITDSASLWVLPSANNEHSAESGLMTARVD